MLVAVVGYMLVTQGPLPEKETERVEIYDKDGGMIASFGGATAREVPYDALPESFVNAVLATEDRNFFTHSGIDPKGIVRAAIANYRAGAIVQGGSTITQQLAKNTYLSSERSYARKAMEAVYALRLESAYDKETLFDMYANSMYFGGGYYGIDAAARGYFDKPVEKLNLHESALLAGLLQAPSRYSPRSGRELAIERAGAVLTNMREAGYIDAAKETEAKAELANLKAFNRNSAQDALGWFAVWVRDQALEHAEGHKAIKVYTTLDRKQQDYAFRQLSDAVAREGDARKFSEAALVTLGTDGRVVTMLGGKDFRNSPFNRVTEAKRSPGSSFKTFVYLNALMNGAHANDEVFDQPINIKGYQPGNYNEEYKGRMMLREAFLNSVNTVAVQLGQVYGNKKTVDLAHRMGIESKLGAYASTPLGSEEVTMMELATAYAHLANEGRSVKPYAITKITDAQDEALYVYEAPKSEQVINVAYVHEMNGLLQDVVQAGTGRAAAIGRPAAGKTGTSQDYRDALFVGYTPQYTTAVWVGNDDNTPTARVTGGSIPAKLWASQMKHLHEGVHVAAIPSSVNSLQVARAEFEQPILPWLMTDEQREMAGFTMDGGQAIAASYGYSQPSDQRQNIKQPKERFEPMTVEEFEREKERVIAQQMQEKHIDMPRDQGQQVQESRVPAYLRAAYTTR